MTTHQAILSDPFVRLSLNLTAMLLSHFTLAALTAATEAPLSSGLGPYLSIQTSSVSTTKILLTLM